MTPDHFALAASITFLFAIGLALVIGSLNPSWKEKGVVGCAWLLGISAIVALGGILAIGMAGARAAGGGWASVQAFLSIIDIATYRQMPGSLLGIVLAVASVLLLSFWGRIRRARAAAWPASRVVAEGPWRGGFLADAVISDLVALPEGLPLGRTLHGGRMVRYAKNDAKGWLGGHHAVISGTRGGKGVSSIMPAIFDHAGGVVALDIKGELARTTAKARMARGNTVVVLDPFGDTKLKGQPFNPMSFIRPKHRDRDAAVIADGLVMPETGSGSHFSDRARACLQTVIEVVHEEAEKSTPPKVPTLHEVRERILGDGFPDTLEDWVKKPDLAGGRAMSLAGSFLAMGERERGSVLSTVAKSLDWTAATAMRTFLGHPNGFNIVRLLDGTCDLFIVVPLDQVGPQAGFMRLMANMLLALMVQQSTRDEAKKPLLFVADEFTRLGRMDRIQDIATVAAGIGLETMFIIQDRGSLEAVYGEYGADTIIGSCATVRVFNLGRMDGRTAKWVSELAGFQTLATQSRSTSTGSTDASTTTAETREPLLSPSDVLELPTDQMICFIRGRKPLQMKRIFWFKDLQYLQGK